MDFSGYGDENDPTLPLNEASVLPPKVLYSKEQTEEDVWSKYR